MISVIASAVCLDVAFGIRQLVDIAMKALSPGVNDASTAAMSVDYLSAILAQLASRKLPSLHRCEGGELKVIALAPSFEGLLTEAFDQIRASAAGNVAVMARMLVRYRPSPVSRPGRATGRRSANKRGGLPNWRIAASHPRMIARESSSN